MKSLDWEVLTRAVEWLNAGYQVHLFTVVQTWGSAPRLPGALLAVRGDGRLVGSVSGGCVEDDLADQAREQLLPSLPALLDYGVDSQSAQRFGIPCGGRLQIFVEPLHTAAQLMPVLHHLEARQLVRRSVHLGTGEVRFSEKQSPAQPAIDGDWFHADFGPQWRLLIIGANQLGAVLANMAQVLDFDVAICDPRQEMREEWHAEGTRWVDGMPDDAVLDFEVDPFTAIVAVTHDPKLDDMALLEALKSQAFYVGALGSEKNQQKRRERLRMFELTDAEIARLHGPVGLRIGSRTPAEIAIAILAELVQVRSALSCNTGNTINSTGCNA